MDKDLWVGGLTLRAAARPYAKERPHTSDGDGARTGIWRYVQRLALRERLRETRRACAVRERYEAAMGALNESFYEWDIARSYFHSDARVLGLPEEMLASAKHWAGRIHPEDRSHYESALIAHLTRATDHFKCEYRFEGFDGRWRWARPHGMAVSDATGRAVRMIGSIGDITELKRAKATGVQRAALRARDFGGRGRYLRMGRNHGHVVPDPARQGILRVPRARAYVGGLELACTPRRFQSLPRSAGCALQGARTDPRARVPDCRRQRRLQMGPRSGCGCERARWTGHQARRCPQRHYRAQARRARAPSRA